jgi:hypothetical protein
MHLANIANIVLIIFPVNDDLYCTQEKYQKVLKANEKIEKQVLSFEGT